MNRISALIASSAIALAAMFGNQCKAQFVPISASEQNRQLGQGINILGLGAEWAGQSTPNFPEAYFDMIAQKGFTNVRVAQALFTHLKPDGTIDPNWLKKLDWVIDQSLKRKLTVIIDDNNTKECEADATTCTAKVSAAWSQIAQHYKNYPNKVLFELLNEPTTSFTPDEWNKDLRVILETIRQTNPDRNVIIGPARANGLDALNMMSLPDDPHIIVTIHYYSPFKFTHQGAKFLPDAHRPALGARWAGRFSDVQSVHQDFDYISMWGRLNHRPIYIGEFGTLETAPMSDRAAWTATVARQAESHGFSWSYWQFENDFAAYDNKSGQWVGPIIDALRP